MKVLNKADMIAKNQITNDKAKRMILMKQAESLFVAKLYFTFQSKENLYLVMEYLNGGDCAALIKSLGSLPEEWMNDLEPDNLLIDQHGHLKLTDFGLRRIGLLGRQTCEPMDMGNTSGATTRNFALSDDASESGPESIYNHHSRQSRAGESRLQLFAMKLTTDLRSYYLGGHTPPREQKFVDTPDYLAPETILGLCGDHAAVDWWALGLRIFIRHSHAEMPEMVFENILSGHIEWHKDWTRPLVLGLVAQMKLMGHPVFEGIEWDKVTSTEAVFIPQVSDPESTDYFNPRGAIPRLFHEEDIGTVTQLLRLCQIKASGMPGVDY
ncbi:serine threonine protein kinase [Suillus discolor]|uniref:non-specific serine/threonine protein kinase n=1 Tax=Suillus discolor TaxID=1912936 RepID=A0A9P7EUV5_9AGAM|nr:serine threonine protein kinase [Suillus discolor]KAG2090589.1 serine threonine protein kinase [Suillus discolor]